MEFIGILIWIFLAWACSSVAKSKNRSVGGWAVLGLFFGIIALIVVALLPPLPANQSM